MNLKSDKLPEFHEESFRVNGYDCDYRGKLLPGGLLRFAQQLAVDHCASVGMNPEFYRETQTAYLLAKQSLKIFRTPVTGEILHCRTTPEKMKRASIKRITEFRDEAGEVVALLDGRWVLCNTETMRILRREPEGYPVPILEEVPQTLEQTVEKPDAASAVAQPVADYALCDTNCHLNNTRYADIVCNALPPELWKTREVEELRIHYHREIPMGQRFWLEAGILDENRWYFQGSQENSCFEAELRLREL